MKCNFIKIFLHWTEVGFATFPFGGFLIASTGKVIYPKLHKHWLYSTKFIICPMYIELYGSILASISRPRSQNVQFSQLSNSQIFSADATPYFSYEPYTYIVVETLILHLFCPWKHEKIPSKIEYFSKICRVILSYKILFLYNLVYITLSTGRKTGKTYLFA